MPLHTKFWEDRVPHEIPAARRFYSLAEAAEITGMSERYLRQAVTQGLLKAQRTGPNGGGHYKFRMADLEAWFEALEPA